MKQHNEIVDMAKGIGIALVILGHLVPAKGHISVIIFSFHMPLFYFLSGYVMNGNISREKYVSRIKTLFAPYVFFSTIGLFISCLVPGWRSGLSLKALIYNVIYNTQPECVHVGQAWFLVSMIWVISIFCIVHRIFEFKTIKCILSAGGGYTLSALLGRINVGVYLNGEKLNFPFKILTAFAAYFFFELGYVSKQNKLIEKIDNISAWNRILLVIAVAIVNIVIALNNGKVNIALCAYNNEIMFILGSLSGIASVILVASLLKNTRMRFLVYYGRNSLPIFLSHSFFLYAYAYSLSVIFAKKIIIMDNVGYYASLVGLIITMILCIPIPWFYNYIVKKIFQISECFRMYLVISNNKSGVTDTSINGGSQ